MTSVETSRAEADTLDRQIVDVQARLAAGEPVDTELVNLRARRTKLQDRIEGAEENARREAAKAAADQLAADKAELEQRRARIEAVRERCKEIAAERVAAFHVAFETAKDLRALLRQAGEDARAARLLAQKLGDRTTVLEPTELSVCGETKRAIAEVALHLDRSTRELAWEISVYPWVAR